jgi:hypothetical protein
MEAGETVEKMPAPPGIGRWRDIAKLFFLSGLRRFGLAKIVRVDVVHVAPGIRIAMQECSILILSRQGRPITTIPGRVTP